MRQEFWTLTRSAMAHPPPPTDSPPSAGNGFDYPAQAVGTTSDGKATLYYDPMIELAKVTIKGHERWRKLSSIRNDLLDKSTWSNLLPVSGAKQNQPARATASLGAAGAAAGRWQ